MSLPIDDFRVEKYSESKSMLAIDAAIKNRVPMRATFYYSDSEGVEYSYTTETPSRKLLAAVRASVDDDDDEKVIAYNEYMHGIKDTTERKIQYRRALNAQAETAAATRVTKRELEKKTINQTLAITNVEKQRVATASFVTAAQTAQTAPVNTPSPAASHRSARRTSQEPGGERGSQEPPVGEEQPVESCATAAPVGEEPPAPAPPPSHVYVPKSQEDKPPPPKRRRFLW